MQILGTTHAEPRAAAELEGKESTERKDTDAGVSSIREIEVAPASASAAADVGDAERRDEPLTPITVDAGDNDKNTENDVSSISELMEKLQIHSGELGNHPTKLRVDPGGGGGESVFKGNQAASAAVRCDGGSSNRLKLAQRHPLNFCLLTLSMVWNWLSNTS